MAPTQSHVTSTYSYPASDIHPLVSTDGEKTLISNSIEDSSNISENNSDSIKDSHNISNGISNGISNNNSNASENEIETSQCKWHKLYGKKCTVLAHGIVVCKGFLPVLKCVHSQKQELFSNHLSSALFQVSATDLKTKEVSFRALLFAFCREESCLEDWIQNWHQHTTHRITFERQAKMHPLIAEQAQDIGEGTHYNGHSSNKTTISMPWTSSSFNGGYSMRPSWSHNSDNSGAQPLVNVQKKSVLPAEPKLRCVLYALWGTPSQCRVCSIATATFPDPAHLREHLFRLVVRCDICHIEIIRPTHLTSHQCSPDALISQRQSRWPHESCPSKETLLKMISETPHPHYPRSLAGIGPKGQAQVNNFLWMQEYYLGLGYVEWDIEAPWPYALDASSDISMPSSVPRTIDSHRHEIPSALTFNDYGNGGRSGSDTLTSGAYGLQGGSNYVFGQRDIAALLAPPMMRNSSSTISSSTGAPSQPTYSVRSSFQGFNLPNAYRTSFTNGSFTISDIDTSFQGPIMEDNKESSTDSDTVCQLQDSSSTNGYGELLSHLGTIHDGSNPNIPSYNTSLSTQQPTSSDMSFYNNSTSGQQTMVIPLASEAWHAPNQLTRIPAHLQSSAIIPGQAISSTSSSSQNNIDASSSRRQGLWTALNQAQQNLHRVENEATLANSRLFQHRLFVAELERELRRSSRGSQ